MTKEDLILDAIKEVREAQINMGKDIAVLNHVSACIDEMKTDVAVLKSQHNHGNLSERVSAGVAILAIIISLAVAVTSCQEDKNENRINRFEPPYLRLRK